MNYAKEAALRLPFEKYRDPCKYKGGWFHHIIEVIFWQRVKRMESARRVRRLRGEVKFLRKHRDGLLKVVNDMQLKEALRADTELGG